MRRGVGVAAAGVPIAARVPLAAGVVLAAMGVASDVATADPINWEAIAQCESGGNWAADTGNGDYGGLQITEATWLANGGQGYPFQASPEQQIAVGNQIMSTQGPGAWPTCASRGDGEAPVGSLTNFLTFLTDHA